MADARHHIQVNSLSFAFAKEAVLKSVTLRAAGGSFLALLGPNGSGKTTLLRLLAGWLKPMRDAVWVEGRDILDYRRAEAARRLAHLPQAASPEAAFTVRETVLMGRAPHLGFFKNEGAADREKVEEALALADVHGLKDRDITTLSGGEWKRVLIAQALAQDAGIMLLDEPTAHLDLSHQRDVLSLLRRLAEEKGLSVIAALHDLNAAAAYADEIIVLNRGAIAAAGAPEEVLSEEIIREVYGVPVLVTRHPESGKPVVLLR